MQTILLLCLAGLFAWLAVDAWRMRGGTRAPYAALMKHRGQSASHLPLEQQEQFQKHEEQHLVGRPDAMYLLFATVSLGCLLAGIFSAL